MEEDKKKKKENLAVIQIAPSNLAEGRSSFHLIFCTRFLFNLYEAGELLKIAASGTSLGWCWKILHVNETLVDGQTANSRG